MFDTSFDIAIIAGGYRLLCCVFCMDFVYGTSLFYIPPMCLFLSNGNPSYFRLQDWNR